MDAQFQAISREAGIAASHIGIGVTSLQRASHAHRAYYYQSFFALSIGFERTAKLALVLNHAVLHGTFPDSQEVRRFGHKLSELLEQTDRIAALKGLTGPKDRLPRHRIHVAIIGVLDDFASNVTRYYNLDFLTGSRRTAPDDAVSDWFNRVLVEVMELHYPARVQSHHEGQAAALDALTGSFTSVVHTSETGQPIGSVFDAAFHELATEYIKPHTRAYVLQIARFLARLMKCFSYGSYGDREQRIPDLGEFYQIYDVEERVFRHKKVWSIY